MLRGKMPRSHTYRFRVRYADTDQMGTFYNARALEWFEVGRSELSRDMGLPYIEWEARGVFLPLVEAHVNYLSPASYDHDLEMTTSVQRKGLARLLFEYEVFNHTTGKKIASGYTVHATINSEGKPLKTPSWVLELIED